MVGRLFALLACAQVVCAQPANRLLTNALDVLSLSGDRAWGIDVSVQGVVTAAQPGWAGRFFVQDATAGIFVDHVSDRQPVPGDLIRVTGVSHPGGFAPIIAQPRWEKLGTAPLPMAKPVPIEQLMAGVEDSQRIEISGIVRAGWLDAPAGVAFEIASGGYRLHVYAPLAVSADPPLLVGAKVRLRGTAATSFNGQLRQLIAVDLYVPRASDFIVESTVAGDPFGTPVLPLNKLGQYRRGRELSERVHVKGTVTHQRPGEDVFIQDATSGLQLKNRQLETLTPGDVVEAVGFLDFEHFLPVLQDAVVRKTGEARETVKPKPAPIWELQAGYRHADLITLSGRVLDRTVRDAGKKDGTAAGQKIFLTLQTGGVFFTVEGFGAEPNAALALIPLGSIVEVDGICLMEIREDGKMKSLQVLLPTINDVRILKRPSWLTPARLRIGMAILFAVLVVALVWIVTGYQKNSALKVLVKEKNKAQQELQESHNLLETRVVERTNQLKIEMTARQEAEVHFKATLGERTRLAQELHDTLEQSLTGIGLQLDTATRLLAKDPAAGSRHIGLARNQMTQSQLELRRSIWDLRTRELEQFDFPTALRVNAQQITEGTHLKLEMETTGPVRALSEVAEENLLRIVQEALTNVIKHAGASEVRVSLGFSSQAVTLRVKDNGQGFTPDQCPGSREGHFGLLGISERAKRLKGHLRVTSTPGNGTCLEVEIPAKLADETDPTGADARGLI